MSVAVSSEVARNIAEEGSLPRCLDDSYANCRHDQPSVDPCTTLRRSAKTGTIFCMNCMRVFPLPDLEIPINTIEGLPF